MGWFFLVAIGLLVLFAVVCMAMAIRKGQWGSVAGAATGLVIAVVGWAWGSLGGYFPTPLVNAQLEITDNIAESEQGGFYYAHVLVASTGDATARNCVMNIEYRHATERQYTYLGYAPLKTENLNPGMRADFWLIAARSYKGAPWKIWIIGEAIMHHVRQGGSVTDFPPTFASAGDHELRLTLTAENAESTPRKYVLSVFEDSDKRPELKVQL